jgi:aspartyl-tRNA(Asn)/glutamyl-tRNA(Gln) amidotransferase subunit A
VGEYADVTAVELERLYADGAADPVAVWQSVRAGMDAWEPVVHATSHRDDATSECEARAAAQRWRTGHPRGPLDGVPVTVKENIATAGIPTPLGTAAAELVPATADAPIVEPGRVSRRPRCEDSVLAGGDAPSQWPVRRSIPMS